MQVVLRLLQIPHSILYDTIMTKCPWTASPIPWDNLKTVSVPQMTTLQKSDQDGINGQGIVMSIYTIGPKELRTQQQRTNFPPANRSSQKQAVGYIDGSWRPKLGKAGAGVYWGKGNVQ